MNWDLTTRRWHRAIVDDAEKTLGRSLKDYETEFIISRGGYIALEMIHVTVKTAGKRELESYLASERKPETSSNPAPYGSSRSAPKRQGDRSAKGDERMKILVLNGTYHPKGTTTELARSFMEGAKASGADVDMIMLRDRTIGYCTNCLTCYGFTGEGIAPCSLKDDMDELIPRIAEADGILFASPVHNGFVTGLMTVFWERLSWRAARPDGPFLHFMCIKTRLPDKVRALGSIASAGGMPERLGKSSCNDGTPWLKSNACLILHGQWIGDMYAGADLEHMPESKPDWQRIFFLRRLSTRQRQQAYALGVRMATAIQSRRLKPVTMETLVHPVLRWMLEFIFTFSPPYRVAR